MVDSRGGFWSDSSRIRCDAQSRRRVGVVDGAARQADDAREPKNKCSVARERKRERACVCASDARQGTIQFRIPPSLRVLYIAYIYIYIYLCAHKRIFLSFSGGGAHDVLRIYSPPSGSRSHRRMRPTNEK